jgi:hypothetical protein
MSNDAILGILIGVAFTLAILFVRSMYFRWQNRHKEAAN